MPSGTVPSSSFGTCIKKLQIKGFSETGQIPKDSQSLNLLFSSERYPCQKAQPPKAKSTVKKHSAAKNTTVTAMPTALLRVSKPKIMNMGNIAIT
jgi:hypothetical protein